VEKHYKWKGLTPPTQLTKTAGDIANKTK
jgi:hypothetical protein